jgi:hypothetical protein
MSDLRERLAEAVRTPPRTDRPDPHMSYIGMSLAVADELLAAPSMAGVAEAEEVGRLVLDVLARLRTDNSLAIYTPWSDDARFAAEVRDVGMTLAGTLPDALHELLAQLPEPKS